MEFMYAEWGGLKANPAAAAATKLFKGGSAAETPEFSSRKGFLGRLLFDDELPLVVTNSSMNEM